MVRADVSQESCGAHHPRTCRLARERIVVAYDGSRTSRRALDAAVDLMGYGSSLTVVHVRAEEEAGRTVELAREDLLRRHVVARYLERAVILRKRWSKPPALPAQISWSSGVETPSALRSDP